MRADPVPIRCQSSFDVLKYWYRIGGLVMDWGIGPRLTSDWQIGRGLTLDWRIGNGLTLDWLIVHGLADWSWIGGLVMD